MKKFLLGCGCLVIVLVGALGFMAMRMVGPIIDQQEAIEEQATARLVELDAAHPFAATQGDQLDTERLARALQLRETLALRLAAEERARRESEELGWLDMLPNALDRVNGLLTALPDVLEAHELGPSELAYHTRLTLAALETIASGAGGPELQGVGRRYGELVGAWGFLVQNNPGAPAMRDLVDAPSPALVQAARDVIAAQPERTMAGLLEPSIEGMLLTLPDMDDRFIEAYVGQRFAELAQRTAGEQQ